MRKYFRVAFILLFVIGWTIFLLIYSPEDLVEKTGVENSYVLVFLSAFLGDLATVTIVSVYPSIVVFAMGGLNPFILGLFAGVGMTFANVIYFFFGVESREAAVDSKRFKKLSEFLVNCMRKMPRWVLPLFILFYVGFTPMPNNVLTAAVGLFGYNFRRLIFPLFLGNLILMTGIAYVFG